MDDGSAVEIIKPELIIFPEQLNNGDLFASQKWVWGKPSRSEPSVYTFQHEGKPRFLVGDGHKRIAESLGKNKPIMCIKDLDLGVVSSEVLNNPTKAQIKFARYGIEGFFPFVEFVKRLKEQGIDLTMSKQPSLV